MFKVGKVIIPSEKEYFEYENRPENIARASSLILNQPGDKITNAIKISKIELKNGGISQGNKVTLEGLNYNHEILLKGRLDKKGRSVEYEHYMAEALQRMGIHTPLYNRLYDLKRGIYFTASEWKPNLVRHEKDQFFREKFPYLFSSKNIIPGSENEILKDMIEYFKNTEDEFEAEALKTFIGSFLIGISDLKLGVNTIFDSKKNKYCVVDSGYCSFIKNPDGGLERWKELIDVAKKSENDDVRKLATTAESFKNFLWNYLYPQEELESKTINLGNINGKPPEKMKCGFEIVKQSDNTSLPTKTKALGLQV